MAKAQGDKGEHEEVSEGPGLEQALLPTFHWVKLGMVEFKVKGQGDTQLCGVGERTSKSQENGCRHREGERLAPTNQSAQARRSQKAMQGLTG